MIFEWDPVKSDATFHQRGFDFAFATGVFSGPVIEAIDMRRDCGETHIRVIGQSQGITLVVVYTPRADARRIISARLANRKECARWLKLSG